MLGFTLCSAGEYFIREVVLLTTVTVLYVRPEAKTSIIDGRAVLRLIRAVVAWSKATGSARVLFRVTSGVRIHESHRMLRRLGERSLGGKYMMLINKAE